MYLWPGDGTKWLTRVISEKCLIKSSCTLMTRFLWRSDKSETPSVFQWLRLNFGDKPAPDIASNVINYLAKVSQVEFPDAAQELRNHAYVDDIAGSKSNSTEVKNITEEIDTVLGKGKFQIKAWHSNCSEIDQSSSERFTDLLGHKWDKEEDKFTFKKEKVVGLMEAFSKRSCLKFLAQLWDPIGLVSPVTIKFRIDLQALWSSGISWDDILPASIQQTWLENVQSINDLLSFQFERKLKPSNAVGVPQIHGFSDGGEQAYGAVIFLRWKLPGGDYRCVPVMTKAFVAPLKKKSIPRLELLGCLALARMYVTCVKALEFTKAQDWERFFWVDSSTVLSWIRTPPREFRPFVSARVAEIQESIGADQVRYIKSNHNPADALTRGIHLNHLMKWSEGPSFLQLPEESWPSFQDHTQANAHVEDLEALKEKKTFQKEKKASKHLSAFAEACPELDQPEPEENPILSHLLKTCPSSDDIWEAPPITPNDLLLGHHNPPPPPEPEERNNPRQLFRSTQNRVADFWRSWMKYFAPNLLPSDKWFRVRDNIQTGDLVSELDPKHRRCEWKMARIVGTYPGNDGLVRKVRIKTRDGEYDRPIYKLCLIATKEELNTRLL